MLNDHAGLVFVALFAGTLAAATRRAAARLVPPASARDLAAIRILVGGILLGSTLIEDVASTAALPRGLVQPMGVLDALYALPIGFAALVESAPGLGALRWATAALLLLATVGWHTRVVLPLAAGAYLVLGGILRQYFVLYHTGLVPLYVAGVLVCTPCADAWSLDARAGRTPHPGDPTGRPAAYAWGRYACWVAIALPYVASGLSKLRNGGLGWADAANMRRIYLLTTLDPMHFDWSASLALGGAPDTLLATLGWAAIGFELVYGTVLVSRIARRVLPPLAVVFHLGVLFLQNLLFLDLIALQLAFVEWSGAGVPPAATRPPWRHAALVALVASALATSWLARIEHYPLTAMQMFSWRDGSGVVRYHRVEAHYASGHTTRADLSACAFRSAAPRMIVARAFDPATRALCAEFLALCAARTRSVEAADPLVGFEVQRWRWDFRNEPESAVRGELEARAFFPLGSGP